MKGNFGFIHEKIEIKILILFILRRLPEPVTYDTLTELTLCDDGIGYFEYSECIAELVRTEHVKVEDGMYTLTAKGERNGEITENSLPFTVRGKAENNAEAFCRALNRNTMIRTSHTVKPDGGCTASMALSDGVGDILSLELFTATEYQAHRLEKGFRRNAESIYKELIGMMLR